MRKLQRRENSPRFVPDFMAKSLHDVDFAQLKKHGVKYIAFDADSTLVPFRGKELSAETKDLLKREKKHFVKWCIASNRITNDLIPLAESMDAQVIRATLFVRKPQRRFFDRVIEHFHAPANEIAMIGDKLLADMYGAKRAGMVTVWVERIGKDSLWDSHLYHTRRWERKLMRSYLDETV